MCLRMDVFGLVIFGINMLAMMSMESSECVPPAAGANVDLDEQIKVSTAGLITVVDGW